MGLKNYLEKYINDLNENNVMSVCDNCHMYKTFGNKCWFYWEHKKTCTQFKRTAEEEPHFCGEELIQITH